MFEDYLQKFKDNLVELYRDEDLDKLIEDIGDKKYVLLGEASHGTSEYYTWRAKISKRLISEKGFNFIAVEGDWPDCYRINRYLKDYPNSDKNAFSVLNKFNRWPTWMWANWEIVAFTEWLRSYNNKNDKDVGFYGLDVYSLWQSLDEILKYLRKEHPDLVHTALKAYKCFEPYKDDEQKYAWYTQVIPEGCTDEVIAMLKSLQEKVIIYENDREAFFNAQQNAIIVQNADKYYRAMIEADNKSWNVRDMHMFETLKRLISYHGDDAKAIVWAHNTHVGDARYTDMQTDSMYNIGQLIRENEGQDNVAIVGFGSYEGTVIAGKSWGAPMQIMNMPKAKMGSLESILHHEFIRSYYFDTNIFDPDDVLVHRAIGVVYNAEHEKYGNYVPTIVSKRYDKFIFLDKTNALHPLHLEPHKGETPPDTFPWEV